MAISQKQLEANRRNAQKSTGPKTAEGKQTSRANATTHGLTVNTTIYRPVRNEDPAEFERFRASLIEDVRPANFQEMLCVEMIAAAWKRMQRADAWEAAFIDATMEAIQRSNGLPLVSAGEEDYLGCALGLGQPAHKLTFANLERYRRNAWLDYNRAQDQLRKLQRDRIRNNGPERVMTATSSTPAAAEAAAPRSPRPKSRKTPATPVLSTEMASFCPTAPETTNTAPLASIAPEASQPSGLRNVTAQDGQEVPHTPARTAGSRRRSVPAAEPRPFLDKIEHFVFIVETGFSFDSIFGSRLHVEGGPKRTHTGSALIVPVSPGLRSATSIVDEFAQGFNETTGEWIPSRPPPGSTFRLFGMGFRDRRRPEDVKVTIAGCNIGVLYAGPSPLDSKLDELKIEIPEELSGSGIHLLWLTVDGIRANPVRVDFGSGR